MTLVRFHALHLSSKQVFTLSCLPGRIPLRLISTTIRNEASKDVRLCIVGTGGNEVSPTLCLINGQRHYWFNCGEGITKILSMHNFGRGIPIALITRASWANLAGLMSLYSWYTGKGSVKEALKFMSPKKHKEVIAEVMSMTCGTDTSESVNSIGDGLLDVSPIELGTDENLVAYSCKLYGGRKSDFDSLHSLDNSGTHFESCGPNGIKDTVFVVLECPHESYIHAICTHKKLNALWFDEQNERLDFIVHISPLKVLETDTYCRWMASFGPDVHHILVHPSVCPSETSWRDSLKISMAFHMMNPEVFHMPIQPKENAILLNKLNVLNYIQREQVTIGCARLQWHIKSGQRSTIDCSDKLSPLNNFVKETYQKILKCCGTEISLYHQNVPGIVKKSLQELEVICGSLRTLTDTEDVMVTFLGTGATLNSNFRNVTSILLQTRCNGNIILDCGEATITQLKKCFGIRRTHKILSKLHTIFLSHLHPDHWTGLFSLLQEVQVVRRRSMNTYPVTIIAPPNMISVLKMYHSIFSDVDCDMINSYHTEKVPYLHNNLIMKTFQVHHVKHTFGIKVCSCRDDWSIVFSGDTRPCDRVIEEGRNTSLLIHEGTFTGKRKIRDSVVKRHSFYDEAANAGIACNADFTAITHFSTAESLLPLMEPSRSSVVPAMDFMSLILANINKHNLDSKEAARVFQSINNFVK